MTGQPPRVAGYDGLAQWYDEWARSAAWPVLAAARDALAALLPGGPGLALDVGCGGGLHADVLRRRGFSVAGVDLSRDQVRVAARRLPAVVGDAAALPVATGALDVVVSVLTHTDVPDFAGVVGECLRVLRRGGVFVYVGVHPCFNNAYAERLPDGVRLHPGYRQPGWVTAADYTGDGVLRRIGAHHLPLSDLFTALTHPAGRLDRVIEAGPGPVPDLLAARIVH